jgi:hypothetical protein
MLGLIFTPVFYVLVRKLAPKTPTAKPAAIPDSAG